MMWSFQHRVVTILNLLFLNQNTLDPWHVIRPSACPAASNQKHRVTSWIIWAVIPDWHVKVDFSALVSMPTYCILQAPVSHMSLQLYIFSWKTVEFQLIVLFLIIWIRINLNLICCTRINNTHASVVQCAPNMECGIIYSIHRSNVQKPVKCSSLTLRCWILDYKQFYI